MSPAAREDAFHRNLRSYSCRVYLVFFFVYSDRLSRALRRSSRTVAMVSPTAVSCFVRFGVNESTPAVYLHLESPNACPPPPLIFGKTPNPTTPITPVRCFRCHPSSSSLLQVPWYPLHVPLTRRPTLKPYIFPSRRKPDVLPPGLRESRVLTRRFCATTSTPPHPQHLLAGLLSIHPNRPQPPKHTSRAPPPKGCVVKGQIT